jgi:hypothetical protein
VRTRLKQAQSPRPARTPPFGGSARRFGLDEGSARRRGQLLATATPAGAGTRLDCDFSRLRLGLAGRLHRRGHSRHLGASSGHLVLSLPARPVSGKGRRHPGEGWRVRSWRPRRDSGSAIVNHSALGWPGPVQARAASVPPSRRARFLARENPPGGAVDSAVLRGLRSAGLGEHSIELARSGRAAKIVGYNLGSHPIAVQQKSSSPAWSRSGICPVSNGPCWIPRPLTPSTSLPSGGRTLWPTGWASTESWSAAASIPATLTAPSSNTA